MPQPHDYVYRVLPEEEWHLLDPIAKLGPIPGAEDAYLCVVIETDEDSPRVVGALFLQPQLHAEPFVVLPEFQRSGISAHAAFDVMEQELTANFRLPLMYHVLVADRPEVLATAQGYGLIPFEGVVPHVKVLQ